MCKELGKPRARIPHNMNLRQVQELPDNLFFHALISLQVTYFKQRRVMEYSKAQTLARLKKEGAQPMPEGMGPPGVQGKTS